jgi:hypothetical protein
MIVAWHIPTERSPHFFVLGAIAGYGNALILDGNDGLLVYYAIDPPHVVFGQGATQINVPAGVIALGKMFRMGELIVRKTIDNNSD